MEQKTVVGETPIADIEGQIKSPPFPAVYSPNGQWKIAWYETQLRVVYGGLFLPIQAQNLQGILDILEGDFRYISPLTLGAEQFSLWYIAENIPIQ